MMGKTKYLPTSGLTPMSGRKVKVEMISTSLPAAPFFWPFMEAAVENQSDVVVFLMVQAVYILVESRVATMRDTDWIPEGAGLSGRVMQYRPVVIRSVVMQTPLQHILL